jgi:hypothetical protein
VYVHVYVHMHVHVGALGGGGWGWKRGRGGRCACIPVSGTTSCAPLFLPGPTESQPKHRLRLHPILYPPRLFSPFIQRCAKRWLGVRRYAVFRTRAVYAIIMFQSLYRGMLGRRRAALYRLASNAAWKWSHLDRKKFVSLLPSANYGMERVKVALRPNIDVQHGAVGCLVGPARRAAPSFVAVFCGTVVTLMAACVAPSCPCYLFIHKCSQGCSCAPCSSSFFFVCVGL